MTPASNGMRNVLVAAGLIAAGIVGTLAFERVFPTRAPDAAAAPRPIVAAATETAPASVSLTPELIARAGIRTSPVRADGAAAAWRAPGTVEANAYRQVTVTTVASGRVTSVTAELGQEVREGQTLLEIYSPELADAERAYLTARADLSLADGRRTRAEKLGGIGAVSQQEVDDARAEVSRQNNTVEGARSRLRLLGLTAEATMSLVSSADITAVARVVAPSAGVVIKRAVSRGQNVDPKMDLLTIADLSSVWIIADVYERDMARVRIGGSARVTSAGLPGESWTGHITYLDPQVAVETRTLKTRVEVSNPTRALRPGMLVDVDLAAAADAGRLVIPRSAIQQIGARMVVFVPDAARSGTFIAREVHVGAAIGDDIEVRDGVMAGDLVVTDGGFALKAEFERIGGRVSPSSAPMAALQGAPAGPTAQRITLKVTEGGFEPPNLQVTAGRPIELVVTRTTDKTCGTEIVVGSSGQHAALPLNTPVTLRIPAMSKGELEIACGMAMLKGKVVAR